MENKQNWFRRHWILTAIGIFVILAMISSGDQEPQVSVWNKTANYTMNDCYEVCEAAYDIAAQTNVCSSSCMMYGKPSNSLDKYVNRVKEIE